MRGSRGRLAVPGLRGRTASTAFATGVAAGPTLFLGLLLEGFYLAPRGMGAIPAIATEADIDDLAAAIGRSSRAPAQARGCRRLTQEAA